MAELIGYLVAFGIVFGIPYMISRKEEHKRLEELYKPKDNNDHSTDEWRR